MTFKKDKTQRNTDILSHVHTKKMRVWHVKDARGGCAVYIARITTMSSVWHLRATRTPCQHGKLRQNSLRPRWRETNMQEVYVYLYREQRRHRHTRLLWAEKKTKWILRSVPSTLINQEKHDDREKNKKKRQRKICTSRSEPDACSSSRHFACLLHSTLV